MNPFDNLTAQENEALLKFPAYIALLAAYSDDKLDEVETAAAVNFTHIKTFTADPLLKDFYLATEKVIEKNITEIDASFPVDKDEKVEKINKELIHLESIANKLGPEFMKVMKQSMLSFKEHVAKAHRSSLVDFIFQVPIKGLTD